jgi:hypothetical protein
MENKYETIQIKELPKHSFDELLMKGSKKIFSTTCFIETCRKLVEKNDVNVGQK